MNAKVQERFIARQRQYAAAWNKQRSGAPPPPFSWGASWLGAADDNDAQAVMQAVDDWRQDPRAWLVPPGIAPRIRRTNDDRLEIIYEAARAVAPVRRWHEAVVFSRRLSKNISGGRIAAIIVPQWNPKFKQYLRRTRLAQVLLLPLSTFVYLPRYGEKLGAVSGYHEVDYETLSPNIGKTVQRTHSDIINLMALGRYLKEQEGFESVGLFSYSVGSLRALIVRLLAPACFDYSIFHFVAHDFAQAVLEGTSTQQIARSILAHLTPAQLTHAWAMISPGQYTPFFKLLGPNVRLVQAKFDLAFGPANVEQFTQDIRRGAPAVEVEEGEYGHYFTAREWPIAASMLHRDFKFIYRQTGLRFWR